MEAVGIGVLPKNSVYSTNVCSSEGFPAAVDAFMDLFSFDGDFNWISTIN